MSTIRGYTKGINNKDLKDLIDSYASKMVTVAKRAGLEAMEEIRKNAVNTWYKSTARHAMNTSTKYKVESVSQKGTEIKIVFRSYVDMSEFEALKSEASSRNLYSSPYSSIVEWRKRHEKDGWQYKGVKQPQMDDDIHSKSFPAVNMPYSIGEYMFRLPWEKGILGLPPYEKHTGTKWINPDPSKKRKQLKGYVEGRFKKEWEKKFTEKYNKMKLAK